MPENTTSTVYNETRIPSQLLPSYELLLDESRAQINPDINPYRAYTGQRIAGMSPWETQAQQGYFNMAAAGLPQQMDDAYRMYGGSALALHNLRSSMGTAGQTGYQGMMGLANQYAPYQQAAFGYQNPVTGAWEPGQAQTAQTQMRGIGDLMQTAGSNAQTDAQSYAQDIGLLGQDRYDPSASLQFSAADAATAGTGYSNAALNTGQNMAGIGDMAAYQYQNLGNTFYGAPNSLYTNANTARTAGETAATQIAADAGQDLSGLTLADRYSGMIGQGGYGDIASNFADGEGSLYRRGRTLGNQGGTRLGNIATSASEQGMMRDADMSDYMNPYMENVMQAQERAALSTGRRQMSDLASRAGSSGAFGGYRHGLLEGDIQRDIRQEMGDIRDRGLNAAFTNAQQMYEADRSAEMGARNQQLQAQQASEASRRWGQEAQSGALRGQMDALGRGQAGDQFAMSGLGNLLNQRLAAEQQAQQARQWGVGAQTGLVSNRLGAANQAWDAQMGGQQAALGAMNQAYGQQMGGINANAALLGQAYGIGQQNINQDLAIQQAAMGADMTGYNMGMGGYQNQLGAYNQGLGAYGQMANLGMGALGNQYNSMQGANNYLMGGYQNQMGATQGIGSLGGQMANLGNQYQNMQYNQLGMLEAAGQRGRAYDQAILDVGYQDFANQRDYPQQQLNWFSNILQGIPQAPSTTQTRTAQQPGLFSTALGTGLNALGTYNAMNQPAQQP